MTPDPGIDDLAARLEAARAAGRTLVTGLTGAVSAGKSTLATRLAGRLSERGLSVEVISTDGFLKPNAVLQAEGALDLKGWPHTFDTPGMLAALAAIPSGPIEIPVHSHVTYDIDPALARRIDRPDILIAEGLNLHLRAEAPAPEDPLDLLLYLDAEEADLEAWYVARFLGFWEAAEHDPASFYARFRTMDRDAVADLARRVWEGVNLPNLRQHIVRARPVADLVVRKGPDHQIAGIGRP
ncbi:type I pantothenate kinase [Phenylobacterium parvum]|uniref:Type I pantothenate kinase n=1 Tax=Phenylobacterium parvum TaxID=2201350 RepID=A0A2Z3HPB4_9CAUL|nr:type I pantothenate kinase [Phenylobacterium parvum]AWM76585.1 type I pantothenate kinase [Phenylobacterium parvum]